MPTVIDSLVVELGLDPKKFTQGQREAMAAFKKTQEDAKKQATDMEDRVQRAINFLSTLQNKVLGYTAAFLGGRGIKEFTSQIIQTDAATGRLGRNFGQNVGEINKWSKAVELAGGSINSAESAFQDYARNIFGSKYFGENQEFIGLLNKMASDGGHAINVLGPLNDQWEALSKNLREVAKHAGIADAYQFGLRLGLPPDVVNLMVHPKRQGFLDTAQKTGVLDKSKTDFAEEAVKKQKELSQSIDHLGRVVISVFGPTMISVLESLSRLIQSWVTPPNTEEERKKKLDAIVGPKEDWDKATEGWWDALFPNKKINDKIGSFFGTLADWWSGIGRKNKIAPTDDAPAPFLRRKGPLGLPTGETPLSSLGGSGLAASNFVSASSSSSNEVNIAQITVNTQATDAEGVARDIMPAVRRAAFASLANYGAA